MSNKQVYAVAMSGGVDSSTAAAILQKSGKTVFGVTMDIHEHSVSAIESASRICKDLGIEHFVLNAREAFKKSVMDVFAEYYSKGLTPNPCAICNRDIKMNILLKFAKEKGADVMATGHYVNMSCDGNTVIMKEASNIKKDQSYFLSLVERENLKQMRFPLGDISSKSETRRLAESLGIYNYEKKESQDICFIRSGDYKKFLMESYPDLNLFSPGIIKLRERDRVVAFHNGIANYTIGQRRGIGVSSKTPLYVVGLNSTLNEVLVGQRQELIRKEFAIFSTNWIIDKPSEFYVSVRLRSLSKKSKAMVYRNPCNDGKARVKLLEPPCTPVTDGQVCALYDDQNSVIGGGIICPLDDE